MSVNSINAAISSFATPVIGGVRPARLARPESTDSASASDTKPLGDASKVEDEVDFSAEALNRLDEISPEEQEVVQELAARDREVRTHEQAHVAAGGPYVRGGPTYTYQKGPDGQNYAIGGEVQIDTAPVEGDPEATVRKAQVVRAAALAPAEPSSQDRAVAAAATKLEQQALAELRTDPTSEAAATSGAENISRTGRAGAKNAGPRNAEPERSDSPYDSESFQNETAESLLDVLV